MNLRPMLLVSLLFILNQSSALADGTTFSGNASWYGKPFHGRKTASGEIFDMNKHSAAHKTLHLITKVMVENPKTGKSAVVRVNDRGPYVKTRVMDLSRKAADDLGYLSHGTAYLDFTVLGSGSGSGAAKDDKDAAKSSKAEDKPIAKSDKKSTEKSKSEVNSLAEPKSDSKPDSK